jgi:hypothetical protein
MSPPAFDPLPTEQAVAMHRNLVALFSEGELRQLCFELGVDFETLSGTTKQDKAREIILLFERKDTVADLLSACKRTRPDATWPTLHTRPTDSTVAVQPFMGTFDGPRRIQSPLLIGAAAGLSVLVVVLVWLFYWPIPPAPPPTTAVPPTSIGPVGAPPIATPEFKIEQFHDPFIEEGDRPPEEAKNLARIPLYPTTKGRVKPHTTSDFVWIVACQLDLTLSNDACRATPLRVGSNGVWHEVIYVFDANDICRDFEVKIWLVNQASDERLNQLATKRFPSAEISTIDFQAPYSLKVRIGLDRNNQDIACDVEAINTPAGTTARKVRG